MEAERTIIVMDWTKPGDTNILKDALKEYIIDQAELLKKRCLSETHMTWDDTIAQKLERAIELYKGMTEYTTTDKVDNNNAVIRRKI